MLDEFIEMNQETEEAFDWYQGDEYRREYWSNRADLLCDKHSDQADAVTALADELEGDYFVHIAKNITRERVKAFPRIDFKAIATRMCDDLNLPLYRINEPED